MQSIAHNITIFMNRLMRLCNLFRRPLGVVAAVFWVHSVAACQQLPTVKETSFKPDTINVLSFGAVGDGITLNTIAINNAIETSSNRGGGTVLIPAGMFVSGPITLKSNVNLHLVRGALLQFSTNTDHYPLVKTNWEGLDAIRCQAPMGGADLENIAITGHGIIDGAGGAWRPVKKNKLVAADWNKLVASGKGVLNPEKDTWYPTEAAFRGSKEKRPGVIAEGYDMEKAKTIKEFLRPNMVSLLRCKRVLLEGVTFQNSPAWCLHPLLSEDIVLRNLTVRNPWNAQNGDGIDAESCKNILMDNCSFDVGDDGICLKSGRDEEGRKRGVPTENVMIKNCTVFHGHGGFVIGSEMSGGVRNVVIDNCDFLGTDVGLRFKTTRGRGGVVEKIWISNIRMTNIVGEAILFDMYYMGKDPVTQFGDRQPKILIEPKPVDAGTPQFRDFYLDNIICKGAETGIMIKGLPEMNVSAIDIRNAVIESNRGLVLTEGDNISFRNITLHSKDDVMLAVHNGTNITFDNIRYKTTNILLGISGEKSKNIRLLNTDPSNASQEVMVGREVSKNSWTKK